MNRIWIIFIIFLLSFLAIIARLFYWQIYKGSDLRRDAKEQYSGKLKLPPQRGDIKTSDGYTLATNKLTALVYANPKLITNSKSSSKLLSDILNIDENKIENLISDKSKTWVSIARKVDEEKIEKIKSLNIEGINFEKEYKRYYPESSMAGQLVGFVGYDQNGNDQGYFGLEGYYNRELLGKPGEIDAEWDPKGAPILIGGIDRIEAQNGRTLNLWIDRTIQFIVEKNLKDAINRYGAVTGSIIVMDPSTGGILAASTFPNYDPSNYENWDNTLYPSPIFASTYEPGSTFKSLVMAAALDEKVITPDTKIDETGQIKIGEYSIKTWNDQYHGIIDMKDVLRYSSNVGMVLIGEKLGKDKLLNKVESFGFGKLSGVDLEEEVAPALRKYDDWTNIDLATLTFGQGIAVTPLQMVNAINSLANGGELLEPHIVKSITDENGNISEYPVKVLRRVVSENTANMIRDMMVYTVDNGEAKWAKPKGLSVAGKTGTAQIPLSGHYDSEKTVASFVGFAPSEKPLFTMLVTLREPSSSPWGSETAAPLFFRIASELISYMQKGK